MKSEWIRTTRLLGRWTLFRCRRCRAMWVAGSDREAWFHLVHHVREDLPD